MLLWVKGFHFNYLVGSMRWYVVHVSLTQSVSILLDELRAVEGGQQGQQKPAILIISHPPTIITLTCGAGESIRAVKHN